jgi:hypothetical protein
MDMKEDENKKQQDAQTTSGRETKPAERSTEMKQKTEDESDKKPDTSDYVIIESGLGIDE